ncbi:signal peptidase I [Shouchella shacheensis]|uniref:signal peptidase I n=1 Tax=Shouchella shacheensis TaxID=1649580 RepID=UPI000B0105E7|nr:signal peptidase I [Shouchella shacheensis]
MEKVRTTSWEWLKAIMIALTLAFIVRMFLFAPIVVDGHSMQPTLEPDDKMIVNQIEYSISEPERFDIVVFHAPGGKDYIKRIIGLPGEKIEYVDDTLHVNDEPIEEPFLDDLKKGLYGQVLTGDFSLQELTGNETVPEDHYFMMGDNRRLSKDSRDIGAIAKEEIIGRANVVVWPFDNIQIVNNE